MYLLLTLNLLQETGIFTRKIHKKARVSKDNFENQEINLGTPGGATERCARTPCFPECHSGKHAMDINPSHYRRLFLNLQVGAPVLLENKILLLDATKAI